jgi:hypothetical protein
LLDVPIAISATLVRALARALTFAARARPLAFQLGIGPQAREDATFYVLTVVLGIAVGFLVALVTR